MQPTNRSKNSIEKSFAQDDVFSEIRRHRLIQICVVTALGLLAILFAAKGVTFVIFSVGLSFLAIALGLAFVHKVLTSAYILLVSLTLMLFALALTGAGLFDLAILGYPGLLIFAAILGGMGLFSSVLFFVIAQCVVIAWLTLHGVITPHIPILSWSHLLFIVVIFVVTGFSVFVLVRDIKHLMTSLHKENIKVQKSQTEIQQLAHHDPLTKLPNRLFAEKLFLDYLNSDNETQQNLAVLFIDLDNFKPINDALGHAAGDILLEQLTQRLNVILQANQRLTRFGGDEFLLLAPFDENLEQLDQLAETLIQQCATEFNILDNQVVISASIGIALAPNDGTEFKQLCRRADIAMYQAKQDGRSTFRYYDTSLEKASDEKFQLLQLMRPAVNEKQFELYYQPMIDLSSGKVVTVEALLRWPQSDGKMIPPDQFIPIAESSGLIRTLGRWVIEEACQYCAQQRLAGINDLRVAVNVSVIQFKEGNLYQIVTDALTNAGLPPEGLELEITESLLIDETEHIQNQLLALSKLGVTIAIDDFGTGYSNLGYLRKFKASTLKIDRTFITKLSININDERLVNGIIDLASSLGLKTVAEGIEDKATLNKLVSMGCAIGQGYYWSKPIPGENLAQFLQEYEENNSKFSN